MTVDVAPGEEAGSADQEGQRSPTLGAEMQYAVQRFLGQVQLGSVHVPGLSARLAVLAAELRAAIVAILELMGAVAPIGDRCTIKLTGGESRRGEGSSLLQIRTHLRSVISPGLRRAVGIPRRWRRQPP